jgi:hypothetical protein
MRDLKAKLEKLRVEAADCDLISNLATDYAKRELFARLSRQLLDMAAEVEAVIAAKSAAKRAAKRAANSDGETNSDA